MPNRALTADDCRAVDLLLDLGAANARSVTRTATAASQLRLAAVERLLGKLDALPSGDPPAGLAARTVRRAASVATAPVLTPNCPAFHLH